MSKLLRTSLTTGRLNSLSTREALIVLEVRDDHLDEVVGLAGHHVSCDDLGHGEDCFLQHGGALVAMAVDLYADEHRQAESDAAALRQRPVGRDGPVALKPLDAAQARRWRQPDAFGEVDIAQSAVLLPRCNNPVVDGVEVRHWHI